MLRIFNVTHETIFRYFYKTLSCFMAFIFILSCAMTGTFAWSELSQHKSNELFGFGKTALYSVILNKYENDIEGRRTTTGIAGAGFYLYKAGTPDQQIGGQYFTDNSGCIIVQELSPGDYYFLETALPYGYDFVQENGEDIKQYPFIINGKSSQTTVRVTAYNQRRSGSLTISKTVENADGAELTAEQKAQQFSFTVTFSDSGTYRYMLAGEKRELTSGGSMTMSHGETAVFEKLPVGVQYTVAELPIEGYVIHSGNASGNISENGNHAEFVNIKQDIPEKNTRLIIKKQVTGEFPEDQKDKLFRFTIKIGEELQSFELQHGQAAEFLVPNQTPYTVLEENYADQGYQLSQITNSHGIAAGQVIEVLATNTYTGQVLMPISGQKLWNMGDYNENLPQTITVFLKTGSTLVNSTEVRPDASGNWRFEFSAPKYDHQGNEVSYFVEEKSIEGWRSSVDGFVITNTYIPPATLDGIPVKKTLLGDEPENNAVFSFVLSGLNNAPMPEGSDNAACVLTLNGPGEGDFGPIRFTRPGTYTYKIMETEGAVQGYSYDRTEYTLHVTVEEQDGQLMITSKELTASEETQIYSAAEFVNTYQKPAEPETETVVVSGKKTWNHGSNKKANYPSDILICVKNGSETVAEKRVSATENWEWSFDLEKYNSAGEIILYSIDEAPVAGYQKTIDGYNIINTYQEKSPPGNIPKTGEDPRRLWIAMALLSGSCTTILFLIGSKKRYIPKYLLQK